MKGGFMRFNKRQISFWVIVMVIICFGLACAPRMIWVKPDASQDDFSKDKYTCMQEAQQPVSSSTVNAYGGYSGSHVRTNKALFKACMNAKGWYLQRAKSGSTSE